MGCAFSGHARVWLVWVIVPARLKLARFHAAYLLWSGQFPLLHPLTVQALALSDCSDRDYPPGDAVGMLCFAAVGSESDDLAAVGALA
jgi:hypothetical protein